MLKERIEKALNDQVNAEIFSALLPCRRLHDFLQKHEIYKGK